MNNTAASLLSQTTQIIAKYDQRRYETGEDFNIFSILDRERYEVSTHSAFLFELLNPKGCHHQGRLFLDLFLETIRNPPRRQLQQARQPAPTREIEKWETLETPKNDLEVRREFPTRAGRRIDFFIRDGKNLVIIEMKIDAGEQQNQLSDYYKFVESEYSEKCPDRAYLLLTLDNREPQSAGDNPEKWRNITFKEDILCFLNRVIKECVTTPVLREAVYQYILLIRKLTNQTNREDEMEEIESLLSTVKEIEAAEAIAKAIKPRYENREIEFWNRLYGNIKERFEKNGFKRVKYEDQDIEDLVRNDKRLRGLEFKKTTDGALAIWIDVLIDRGNYGVYVQVYLNGNDFEENNEVKLDQELIFGLPDEDGWRWFAINHFGPDDFSRDQRGHWLFNEEEFSTRIANVQEEINQFLDVYEKEEADVIEKCNRVLMKLNRRRRPAVS
ncbi:MAG: PD-(D/E)XK nuclease family protein [Azoarcus sp.]|nr:PD-(D/E)XK nuclease family protein [Azoarcus sp.]